MTRPTTDGDTAIEPGDYLRQAIENYWAPRHELDTLVRDGAFRALDSLTTRLSEQELELERLREKAQAVLDACWGSFPVGTGAVVSDLEAALTPTTEDREG